MLDTILEHALKYWIGWVCGILASMVTILWRRFTKFKKENKGMHNGLLLIGEKLAAAGIEVTPQIEQVIDGVIAIVCMLMPHESDKDDKLTDGEAEQLNQDLGI